MGRRSGGEPVHQALADESSYWAWFQKEEPGLPPGRVSCLLVSSFQVIFHLLEYILALFSILFVFTCASQNILLHNFICFICFMSNIYSCCSVGGAFSFSLPYLHCSCRAHDDKHLKLATCFFFSQVSDFFVKSQHFNLF